MTSKCFHQLEGETIILRSNGTFQQADVYEYEGCLFAKKGAGYVRLTGNGTTSVPKTFWENLTVPHKVGELARLSKK